MSGLRQTPQRLEIDPALRDAHYHLRRTCSGRVEDLPSPFDVDLPARLDPGLFDHLDRLGFELPGSRLELVGRFTGAPAHLRVGAER